MTDAPTAALDELVTVRALEWTADTGVFQGRAWSAQTPIGEYFISEPDDGGFGWGNLATLYDPTDDVDRDYSTLEAAKAAAQGDYDARILAAIEPGPKLLALVEALELAANRLPRRAIDYDVGTLKFVETCEWVRKARAARAALAPKPGAGE